MQIVRRVSRVVGEGERSRPLRAAPSGQGRGGAGHSLEAQPPVGCPPRLASARDPERRQVPLPGGVRTTQHPVPVQPRLVFVSRGPQSSDELTGGQWRPWGRVPSRVPFLTCETAKALTKPGRSREKGTSAHLGDRGQVTSGVCASVSPSTKWKLDSACLKWLCRPGRRRPRGLGATPGRTCRLASGSAAVSPVTCRAPAPARAPVHARPCCRQRRAERAGVRTQVASCPWSRAASILGGAAGGWGVVLSWA